MWELKISGYAENIPFQRIECETKAELEGDVTDALIPVSVKG